MDGMVHYLGGQEPKETMALTAGITSLCAKSSSKTSLYESLCVHPSASLAWLQAEQTC